MAISVSQANVNRLGAILGAGEGAGGLKIAFVTITGDTSYVAGGSPNVTQTLAAAGLDIANRIYGILPITQLGYEWDYLSASDKLKVYQQPASAAAGPSPEVPATTNLSGVAPACLVLYE